MKTHSSKPKENPTDSKAKSTGSQQSSPAFTDNRPETVAQRKLQAMADSFSASSSVQLKANKTGLPDNLKAGVENLSGHSMDDVKVHYNSSKPASLQAHAYAQGSDIHLAPGQEKHLPHEAWHVAQQKQGRVKPTTQLKGIGINNDSALESEADSMGAKSLAAGEHAAPASLRTTKLHSSVSQAKTVVQRIAFTNNTGGTIDLSENEIVEHLHKWIIDKMKTDTLTTGPIDTDDKSGHLNWDELYTHGGLPRKNENISDMYTTLKEAKMSPGYAFSLDHHTPGHEHQFASSTLVTHDRTSKTAIDGMLYPSNSLDAETKGDGVAYKELTMSFSHMAAKVVHGTPRGDAAVARAHLALMQGGTPDPAAAYTASEISKMHYHLEVMHLAEGRRNAGMFIFSPMTLQNIADGKLTGAQAFGSIKMVPQAPRKGSSVVPPDKPEIDVPGTLPSAWVGSKAPLEEIEKHLGSGGSVTDNALTKTKDNRTALDKMRHQVTLFFSTADHTDFSTAPLNATTGANFTNKDEALIAVVNLIRDKYFPTVPALHEPGHDTVERAQNRNDLQHRLDQRNALHDLHILSEDMDQPGAVDMLKSLLPTTKEDANLLTDPDPTKQAHNKRRHKLNTNLRKEDMEEFSDDNSADELEKEVLKPIRKRNQKKKATPDQRKKMEQKRKLVGSYEAEVEDMPEFSDNDSETEYLKKRTALQDDRVKKKRMKTDPYQKGEDCANKALDPLATSTFIDDDHDLFMAGYHNRVNELEQEGYMAGLKDDSRTGLNVHPLAGVYFAEGIKDRNKVIEKAKADKGKGDDTNFAGLLVHPEALQNPQVSTSLISLYYQAYYT